MFKFPWLQHLNINGIRTIPRPDNSPPGQFPTRTIPRRTIPHPDNSPPGQFPDGQFPPGQFPTRTIPHPDNSPTDNSPPGQFPDRTIPHPHNSPTIPLILVSLKAQSLVPYYFLSTLMILRKILNRM